MTNLRGSRGVRVANGYLFSTRLFTSYLALIVCIGATTPALEFTGVPGHRGRAKFEPADGRIILFIGQTEGEVTAYSRDAGVGNPPGYMLYTSLDHLQGLTAAFKGEGCNEAGVQDLQKLVMKFPGSAAQIGLFLGGQLQAVNAGRLDGNIRSLAEILRKTDRPIFLRIGYEFDGPWNGYDPRDYVLAFQRIVSIFRGSHVDGHAIPAVANVAFVWHSAAWKTFGDRSMTEWYPGDQFVDWIGLSWFAWGTTEANAIASERREVVRTFARQHGKPLMIAESAPKKYFPPTESSSWSLWYSKVFEWMFKNNVKAFSYINQDWNAQQMWRDPSCKTGMDWGDTRVLAPGSRIVRDWQSTIRNPRFVKAGRPLYESIGFSPQ